MATAAARFECVKKDFTHAFDLRERLTELVALCFVLAQPEEQSPIERWQHFSDLADFALAMKVTLNNLNNQSFNNFMLRIGAFTFVCVCVSPSPCACFVGIFSLNSFRTQ